MELFRILEVLGAVVGRDLPDANGSLLSGIKNKFMLLILSPYMHRE